jgi:hypothetical protein
MAIGKTDSTFASALATFTVVTEYKALAQVFTLLEALPVPSNLVSVLTTKPNLVASLKSY